MALFRFSGGIDLCCCFCLLCSEGVWILDFFGNLLRIIIMPAKDIALRKNTAHGAIAPTINPPMIGPITRPILLARALRVNAAGISVLDTNPLMVGIMGVLIIVVPAPSEKVSINN